MTVRAQREGLDQVGAGLEVLAVRGPHEVRPDRGQLVEARAWGTPRENSSVPIPPSARSGPSARRSRRR